MKQPALPGLEPGFVRFELELGDHGLWTVHQQVAEFRGTIHAALRMSYSDLSWTEAVDIMADCIDSIQPACRDQGPF